MCHYVVGWLGGSQHFRQEYTILHTKIAYTNACNTYCTITVYITIFLKINPLVRNKKTSKLKNLNINLENVHFVGLYCIIILQCTVHGAKNIKFPGPTFMASHPD